MTEPQKLLADYAERGSETAFRELVTRYINLVYSTALRLVNTDQRRAEDVAQVVFADLAQTARKLPQNDLQDRALVTDRNERLWNGGRVGPKARSPASAQDDRVPAGHWV